MLGENINNVANRTPIFWLTNNLNKFQLIQIHEVCRKCRLI